MPNLSSRTLIFSNKPRYKEGEFQVSSPNGWGQLTILKLKSNKK